MIIALSLIVLLIIFIVSALPLYFSVKFLGGKTSLFKVIIVNILVAIVSFMIHIVFNTWAGLIAFVAMIWVYREMFRLKWMKALLAWILQFVFVAMIFIILFLFGISLF